MKKVAVLFPGQGAQFLGMGKEFYETEEVAKNIFDLSSKELNYSVSNLCFQEENKLNQTLFTQPSIVATSIAIYESFRAITKIMPDYVLGFSLGEYSALYASGVFDVQSTISLVNKRAIWMDEQSKVIPGGMIAIIGANKDEVNQLCQKVSTSQNHVSIANYNSPSQIVVSGDEQSLKKLQIELQSIQTKRILRLNVSGAFHTSFMKEPAKRIQNEVINSTWKAPNIPIIMNCDAKELESSTLPLKLKQQIEGPIYFEDSIRYLMKQGVDLFIEIGPGQVLSGLIKKIDLSLKTISISVPNDIKKWEEFQ
ncbi:MAG: ACP S-malonyltransferase [Firmicutes bacterium]|nr:ACP S-malonyltransferase [Bacillota bacterium]